MLTNRISKAVRLRTSTILATALLCTAACLSAAQGRAEVDKEAAPSLVFDAVSIKRSGDTNYTIQATAAAPVLLPLRPFLYLPGKLTCNLPLKALIREAYALKAWQVFGPKWMESEMYEIAAIMPPATSRQNAQLMLRAALKERFRLKVHPDKKLLPIYALVVANSGHRLQRATNPKSEGSSFTVGRGKFDATAATVESIADRLSLLAKRPVFNKTGIPGVFKVTIRWTPDYDDGPEPVDRGLFDALERQLGLKLKSQKAHCDILVVDHVDKVPSPN